MVKGVCNLAHRPSIISLNGELEVEKYKNSVRYMTHRADFKRNACLPMGPFVMNFAYFGIIIRSSLVGITALTGGQQNPLLTVHNKVSPVNKSLFLTIF